MTEARKRAKDITRTDALNYKKNKALIRTPVIVTHNPANPPIRKWIRELHNDILMHSDRMAQVSPLPPILGERNCRNIKSILMPSIVPPRADQNPGCNKCNRSRCIICENHLISTKTFSSHVTKETFTIRNELSCESRNVIYLLFCDQCHNSQYTGETVYMKDRFYQHRSDTKLNSGTLVTIHFHKKDIH